MFAIIQGGLDPALRKKCIEEMVRRDTPGYAIGGLSGGEEKDKFWRVVSQCTDLMPREKPIYCMGVGYVKCCFAPQLLRESNVIFRLGRWTILDY